MGVPKFFKYISERYPCLSEKIKEHQVPEFDNLYLDMNGIIHTCSHPNDADVKFRITEETIFKNIFHYIEILFRIIQPKKLFFLAVDGVAPRAKINQQRSRRFRSAKEAELLEIKAKNQGIELPKEARFDSNCITPGTAFMAKLNKQLQYFISYKISTDKHWHKCKVILSGSEVPGEGEHKIMDYIRYMKSQPDYDSNTRHCLYGLDADLMMLGLCTHEPHFTLLREEVLFGKQQKVILTPEETNFCLLHLSLMRNYLEHEFSAVKGKISFEFDIEKIIDDWVLLGFLVGNDFIPHLPNFHIAKGILEILYQAYMDVLPTLDGYINEEGTLNLSRFEKFMVKLSEIDHQHYEEMYEDLKYLEGKSTERNLEPFECDSPDEEAPKKRLNKDLEALINDTDELMLQSDEEENSEEELINSFTQHKKYYYMNKLEYKNVDAEVLRSQAEGYVRAIQWNLNYYYNGCSSWSWYYPHHYAPYISDVRGFEGLQLEFDLGVPFLPFQQLLAVLPAASKGLLPKAYQDLLVEEESPIIQYYPPEFMTDLNGKQNDWEAVVLIPFIEEDTLLKAMKPGNEKLEVDEKQRNQHGPMCVFTYQETSKGDYKAPEYFPSFVNHAKMVLVNRDDILVPKDKLRKGLCPGVRLDLHFPGFPTLKHIDHTAKLIQAKVRVFERASKEQSMILYVTPKPKPNLEALGKRLLGNAVFVGWPHFFEAKVVAISDGSVKYQIQLSDIVKEEMKHLDTAAWNVQKKGIIENHKTRMGIELGDVGILIHACPIIGRKYIYGLHCKVTLEKIFSPHVAFYPFQTIVENLNVYDPTFVQYSTVQQIFSPGAVVFMLGQPHYGEMGKVDEIVDKKSGRVRVTLQLPCEPDLHEIIQLEVKAGKHFMYGGIAAQHLGISSHLLSRITGTIFVVENDFIHNEKSNKFNFGLNLKFNKKNAEVKGYTKKVNGQWLYSTKSIDLIREYMQKCPELFEKLDKSLDAEVFTVSELFPKGMDQVKEVLEWLKEQQKKCNLTPRSCGEEDLDPEVVGKLEEVIDKFPFTRCTGVLQVKPHLLFKPGLNEKTFQPDADAVHKMFDRIIIVKEGFTVPLGLKGTVIGIQKAENPMDSMYTVLFDQCFEGGMLSPATQKHRVYRVTVTDFINCSHGKRECDKSFRIAKKMDRIKNEKERQKQLQSTSNPWQKDQQTDIPNNNLPPPHPMEFPKFFQQKNKPGSNANNPQNFKHQKGGPNLAAAPSAKELPKFTKFQAQGQGQERSGQEKKANPQGRKMDQNTEFQALWNECHKAQVKTQSPRKTPNVPKTPVAKINNVPKVAQPNVQVNTQAFPQDPSAFLKAMLKISDDSSATASQPTKIVPLQAPNASDAPPLVQQLFDNARKAEKLKNQQQQLQQAMQGQIYNPQMKPMEVVMGNQNRHPSQNFAPPPMPIPAPPPKQWINQNAHTQNRPMPRPSFPSPQHQQPMYPIPSIPPKWAMPPIRLPPPHARSYFFNPRNGPPPMPQMDKPNMRPPFPHLAQMAQQMNVQAPKVEQEARVKNTPFVPLQAEKKRNQRSQHHKQKKESDNLQKETAKSQTVAPPLATISKEIPENAASIPVEKQEPSVNTQRKNTNRRKKSRLAANFGNAAVQNGAGSQ